MTDNSTCLILTKSSTVMIWPLLSRTLLLTPVQDSSLLGRREKLPYSNNSNCTWTGKSPGLVGMILRPVVVMTDRLPFLIIPSHVSVGTVT